MRLVVTQVRASVKMQLNVMEMKVSIYRWTVTTYFFFPLSR
jgi:hypothetical protein